MQLSVPILTNDELCPLEIDNRLGCCLCVSMQVEPEDDNQCWTSSRTCYLVDPASSHMLVSKIKPCMCKYEQIQTVKLRMAH